MEIEKTLNVLTHYFLYGDALIMVTLTLSQVLSIPFIRGLIELILAFASFYISDRSRSEIIQNVTVITGVVLFLMGVYDILSVL